ncbi:MAG: DUF3391 domain-containing protein, partial [Methylococcaceae bacterium]|nr:DUF3391 domain-containing protein [Methylococcaceae bacterium]
MKNIPLDVVHFEMVKLRVRDLRKGMFVCEIDRPWSETPFRAEGFQVETDADIERIRRYCQFVYIDLGRTQAVRVKIEQGPTLGFIHEKKHTSLEKEILVAEAIETETSSLVKTFLHDLRFGQSVDVQLAKTAVSQCVASILRNPDAMMFMTRLEQKNPHCSLHAFNVCIYSIVLGRLKGMEPKQLEDLGTCGLLHDIGTIRVPYEIYNKTTKLTDGEFA